MAIFEVCAYVFVVLTESFLLLTFVFSSIWVAAAAFVCLTSSFIQAGFKYFLYPAFLMHTQDKLLVATSPLSFLSLAHTHTHIFLA